MTTLEAINFAARITIGTIIESNGMKMRVDAIKKESFTGQTIYKGKEMGLTVLSFKTLLNPHYCKTIKILN